MIAWQPIGGPVSRTSSGDIVRARTPVYEDCYVAYAFQVGLSVLVNARHCRRVQLVESDDASYLAIHWMPPRAQKIKVEELQGSYGFRFGGTPRVVVLSENVIGWEPTPPIPGQAQRRLFHDWESVVKKIEAAPDGRSKVLFERHSGLFDVVTAAAAATWGEENPYRDPSTHDGFARDPAVRRWALSRAQGHCELCKEPAPFETDDGEPYLEVHHIKRLADGGPDTPRNVAALCPNCHREVHLGRAAGVLQGRLRQLRSGDGE